MAHIKCPKCGHEFEYKDVLDLVAALFDPGEYKGQQEEKKREK